MVGSSFQKEWSEDVKDTAISFEARVMGWLVSKKP